MRATVVRTALAAAGLAIVGLVGSSSAATAPVGPKKLVVTDATGDGLNMPGDDLTKLVVTTVGKTTKVGKKTVYTPKALTFALTVAGGLSTNGTVDYEFVGNIPGCGDFYVDIDPGAALGDYVGSSCSDDDAADFSAADIAIAGDTLTMTVPFGTVTGVKAGVKVTGLAAYTGATDPVVGIAGPVPGLGVTPAANDAVESDATYTIG